nr:HAMP domain-containing sensor histidine kinase [Lysobacter sp. GX 14042]
MDGTGPDPASDPSVRLLERLAHDLRGPLSPIQTATYLLRQEGLEPGRRDELLAILDRQAVRLSEMVQEISDWVRASDGRLVARREPVEVPLLLDLAAGSVAGAPPWELAAGLQDRRVDGDTQRLVQMLATLAGFLHARGGLARLQAMIEEGGLRLELESGVPWDGDEGPMLFAGPHPAPPDQGLGMGLLVAREIARAHGGSVDPGDARAGGAQLVVRLPLAG